MQCDGRKAEYKMTACISAVLSSIQTFKGQQLRGKAHMSRECDMSCRRMNRSEDLVGRKIRKRDERREEEKRVVGERSALQASNRGGRDVFHEECRGREGIEDDGSTKTDRMQESEVCETGDPGGGGSMCKARERWMIIENRPGPGGEWWCSAGGIGAEEKHERWRIGAQLRDDDPVQPKTKPK